MTTILKPKALKQGDTIAIISPSFATTDPPDAFEQGTALLEKAGFNVKLMPHVRDKHFYLAGRDKDRASDLMAAFSDTAVDAILCSRGGYGCMRMLPYLDFDVIRKNPKVFIGFSDVTTLHTAFYQEGALRGFYGPMLTSNLIHQAPYTLENLLAVVTENAEIPFTVPNNDDYHCITSGTVEAPMIGGNLSLLAALCGTKWHPQTDGHILFIEDWKEQHYSLDRQFQQLRLAGVFDNIKGLILADFSEIDPDPDASTLEILTRLTEDLGVPTGYGFSLGHGDVTATFPIGVKTRFNADTGEVTILESPVE